MQRGLRFSLSRFSVNDFERVGAPYELQLKHVLQYTVGNIHELLQPLKFLIGSEMI